VFNGDRAVVLRRPGSEWADVPAVGECPKVARKRLFASVL
jgi:hypothetical protein